MTSELILLKCVELAVFTFDIRCFFLLFYFFYFLFIFLFFKFAELCVFIN